MSSCSSPVGVFDVWESLVDLIQRHQLFLAATAVRAGVDRLHGDGVDVLATRQGTVACVVAEAVFHSYDDPVMC